jgi:hypothetical protein
LRYHDNNPITFEFIFLNGHSPADFSDEANAAQSAASRIVVDEDQSNLG